MCHPEYRKYPYLLRDLVIGRPNQVWFADITYLPMRGGFLYLVAVMDGRGCWLDNVFIERLSRSLKYECVYLHTFEAGSELRAGLGSWIAIITQGVRIRCWLDVRLMRRIMTCCQNGGITTIGYSLFNPKKLFERTGSPLRLAAVVLFGAQKIDLTYRDIYIAATTTNVPIASEGRLARDATLTDFVSGGSVKLYCGAF